MILLEGERLEDIGSGIKIIQSREYYRFSEDSVLLADFIDVHTGDSILDLGTGSGIIPLLLFQREQSLKITGIEIQKGLAYMAQRSIEYNNFDKSIAILQGDLRDSTRIFGDKKWDRVITNPPYFRINEGRISPKEKIAIARHEVMCTLEDVIETASLLLKASGSFYIVHRYDRLLEILSLCNKKSLFPTKVQPVSVEEKKTPYLILVKCLKQVETSYKVLPVKYLSELIRSKLNIGESDENSTPPDLAKLGTFLVPLTGVSTFLM